MVRRTWWSIAGLALVLGATQAQAQQLKADQDTIVAELKAKGYRAELVVKEDADYVRTSDSGFPVTIFFNDCKAKKRGCTTVQFYTGFADIDVTPDQINKWSAEHRWVRTYIDADKDPVLEMDVNMDYGGLGRDLFWDNLNTFFSLIDSFQKEFG